MMLFLPSIRIVEFSDDVLELIIVFSWLSPCIIKLFFVMLIVSKYVPL